MGHPVFPLSPWIDTEKGGKEKEKREREKEREKKTK